MDWNSINAANSYCTPNRLGLCQITAYGFTSPRIFRIYKQIQIQSGVHFSLSRLESCQWIQTYDNFQGLSSIPTGQNSDTFALSSSMNSEEDFAEENDFSDTVLKFISQILDEEESEDETGMFQDFSALQAAEKSFYDILGEKYPSPPNQPPPYQNVEIEGDSINYSNCNSCVTANNLVGDLGQYKSPHIQIPPVDFTYQSNSLPFFPPSITCDAVNVPMDSTLNTPLFPCLVGGNQPVFQFERGIEETRKFPRDGNRVILDFENNRIIPFQPNEKTREEEAVAEEEEGNYSISRLSRRKNYEQEIDVEEGRSKKHSTLCAEEPEQSEMFDEVLLNTVENEESESCTQDMENGPRRKFQQNEQSKGFNGGTVRPKKWSNKREVVDLWTLLIQCSQVVAGNDSQSANDLLKQIRQHSSPFGDGSQRLAHCFANGLEARLAGTGSQVYKVLAAKRTSAAYMLKATQLYLSACPFLKMRYFFITQTILELAEKSSSLHIIHLGIRYGFQWPCLIQCLSKRPGGPPKLRITGIDLPLPGLRPAARIEETGHRLANYCKRFNVPFEYNAIAQKWETVQLEDLKIETDELLVVSCLDRFRYIIDETVMVNSPRNAVLNLIKRINPDIFMLGILNGTYNSPFFISRFREALLYYSAVFDMLEANVPCEDQERMLLEQEIYGKEILNIIACEGSERIERPNTYKQWQVQMLRAGFKQIPLNQELMKKVRSKVKLNFHQDFVVDEECQWMLQGWKGRILYAISCWKSAQE